MNDTERDEALRLAKEAGLNPGYISWKLPTLVRLIALARATAEPQKPSHGWVMLPREPQPKMMRTILQSLYDASGADFDATEPEAYAVYRAIVAAAPQLQAPSATSDDVRNKRIAELEEANLGLANQSHCYESALLELLRQVEKFCEEQGEANFYTGDVKKVLQASSMDYQLGCIDVMNSDVDYAERMQAKAEAALADARDKALEEAAQACDRLCDESLADYKKSGSERDEASADRAWHCVLAIRALRTNSES